MIEEIIANKSIKTKEKTENLSQLILDGKISVNDVVDYAILAKDPNKATCIEALEFATKKNPSIANNKCLEFVSHSLQSKAPRVKWESAKVIGNIAATFPEKLDLAIKNLLINTEDPGTVVRWSAAYALGEIVKLNRLNYKSLVETIEVICLREEKNSIKKIYQAALKKIKK